VGTTIEKSVLAVLTVNREDVEGGAPIFVVKDEDELQRYAVLLENILDGMVHTLKPGLAIIVRHG
jgi:hypothetical protein